jgi:hypothetical protein
VGSPFHIGCGIEGIGHPQAGGGLRHELHEPLRAFGGYRPRIESTLGVDHAVHKIRIQLVAIADGCNHLPERRWILDGGCGRGNRGGFGRWNRRRCGRSRRRKVPLEVVDLGGRNVNVAGVATRQIESRHQANLLPPFMTDGKAVLQVGEIGSQGRNSRQQHAQPPNEFSNRHHSLATSLEGAPAT